MNTYTIPDTHTTLSVIECAECGVLFAMPRALYNTAREYSAAAPGKTHLFYCPNGHSLRYDGRNREQELADQVRHERERAALMAAERDQAEASARAYKGAATRARRRAGAGVCPCCKRTFKALARHMASKHPGYDPEEGT